MGVINNFINKPDNDAVFFRNLLRFFLYLRLFLRRDRTEQVFDMLRHLAHQDFASIAITVSSTSIIETIQNCQYIGFRGYGRNDPKPDTVLKLYQGMFFEGLSHRQGKGITDLGDRSDQMFSCIYDAYILGQGSVKISAADLHIGHVILTGHSLCHQLCINISKLEDNFIYGDITLFAKIVSQQNLLLIYQPFLEKNISKFSPFVLVIQNKTKITLLYESQFAKQLTDCQIGKNLLQFKRFLQMLRRDQVLLD